jgi:hypothetical protein
MAIMSQEFGRNLESSIFIPYNKLHKSGPRWQIADRNHFPVPPQTRNKTLGTWLQESGKLVSYSGEPVKGTKRKPLLRERDQSHYSSAASCIPR